MIDQRLSTVAVLALFFFLSVITIFHPDAITVFCTVGTGIILGFCIGLDVERGVWR